MAFDAPQNQVCYIWSYAATWCLNRETTVNLPSETQIQLHSHNTPHTVSMYFQMEAVSE